MIYAMRWNTVEKQVRKSLELEFKQKTDQAFEQIEKHRNEQAAKIQKFSDDLESKIKEADQMQEKNVQSGRIQAKQEFFVWMIAFIDTHYTSTQTKTKLKLFASKFKEQLKV